MQRRDRLALLDAAAAEATLREADNDPE